MRATKFDKKITVKYDNTSKTETGGTKTNSLTTRFTDWARVEEITGTKRLYYTSAGSKNPIKITMRKRTMQDTDTIVYNGSSYNIEDLRETEDERFLIIEATKKR